MSIPGITGCLLVSTQRDAEIARPDIAAPYRKGGHRETCFIVRVVAHYKFMFDSWSIIWAAHRIKVYSSISFCFSYSYVKQTKLASSLVNVWVHYKPARGATRHTSLQSSEVVATAAVADSDAPEVVAAGTGACLPVLVFVLVVAAAVVVVIPRM